MRRGKYLGLFALFLFAFMLVSIVQAQVQLDDDGDGVINDADACPATNLEEGLPIVIRDGNFLGCSCSQIYEKLGSIYCFDISCSSGRPFSMSERDQSSRKTNCPVDYCIDDKLYDFPENIYVECVNGNEKEFKCDAQITEKSALCINGSVGQYEEVNDSIVLDAEGKVLLDDYQKLQKRAYEASQDVVIKTGLGISGEPTFMAQAEKTMKVITLEKNSTFENRVISGSEKTISTRTIKIIPDKLAKMKQVYVFEELPRGENIDLSKVIPKSDVVYSENGPVLLVWEIDKISEPMEISYQVNAPLQGESITFVVAKEVRKEIWKLLIVPVIVIIALVFLFIYLHQKSIPRRKKIFKE